MRRAFALVLPLVVAAAWSVPFQDVSAAPKKAPAPSSAAASSSAMEIRARTTEYDGKKHTYTVTGDVRITLEDLVVTCRQATIFATAAEDRVERVLFSGDVIAKRGANVFTGETITFHLQTRRLLAEGGTKTRIMVPASTPSAR